jgi:hypothetical protein
MKTRAEASISLAYMEFSDVVKTNTKLYRAAVEASRATHGVVESERSLIAKCQRDIVQTRDAAGKSNGVAYKVKINSTNRAGLPIVWIWTIAVIQANGEWKVSYRYNEEEFGEQKDSKAMQVALMSILGK